jgi:Ricin-type beta-trefoil lectin domain
MKTWTINSNLAALSLGAFLAACSGVDQSASGAEPGLESVDPTLAASDIGETGETGEAITACDDHQYDHWRYLAALGVAAAQELGRWQPTVDFVSNVNTGISLSATGLARCKDGCDNIQGILSLQNNGDGVIPRHDAALLKSKFISFFDRQMINDQVNGLIDHELTATSVGSASCGLRYWFSATQKKYTGTTTLVAAHSNKCVNVTAASTSNGANIQQYQCTGGDNTMFTLESQANGSYRLKAKHSGKCMRVTTNQAGANVDQNACDTSTSQQFDLIPVNGKFQLKNRSGGMCLDVAGVSTANNANVQVWNCGTGANQQFTMAVTNTSVPLANPAALANNLLWVGGVDNAYLSFLSNATEVSIDPTGTMVDGGSTAQSGACVVSSSVFDSTRTSGGKCCEVEGKFGTLQQTTWNKSLYYCK